jgi:hypothetical protein
VRTQLLKNIQINKSNMKQMQSPDRSTLFPSVLTSKADFVRAAFNDSAPHALDRSVNNGVRSPDMSYKHLTEATYRGRSV